MRGRLPVTETRVFRVYRARLVRVGDAERKFAKTPPVYDGGACTPAF